VGSTTCSAHDAIIPNIIRIADILVEEISKIAIQTGDVLDVRPVSSWDILGYLPEEKTFEVAEPLAWVSEVASYTFYFIYINRTNCRIESDQSNRYDCFD
jgi:hypothetical protein